MASTITQTINTIDVTFPVAGQDNDSQGFRNNFSRIKNSLLGLDTAVSELELAVETVGAGTTIAANHLVAYSDLTIGRSPTDNVSFFALGDNNELIITSGGDISLKPNTGVTVFALGAYALTDSVTNSSTGTFAVDDVRAIQIGAEITFNTTTYTVTRVDEESNLVTVTPEIPDSPRPFAVGDTLTFNNPFTSTTTASNLMVYGDIYATGNITAFAGAPSDFRLKENITTIPNALSMVSSMRGVMYDWTDEYLKSLKIDVNGLFPKRDTGVIAQEMQDVLPEVVFVKNNGDLSVKYEKIVGVLIEAIKELKSEVDTLKEKINTGS
jgi:hypothetical protein